MGRFGRRTGLAIAAIMGATLAMSSLAEAAPARNKAAKLSALVERIHEAQTVVTAAERAAAAEFEKSEDQLAKQVVSGQLMLAEGDYEGAAILFLDVLENHASSQAAPEAVHYLGVALAGLGMNRWASEMFVRNLSDTSTAGRRFHQRSVAALFDLASPRRAAGFAEQPGLSAMPEVRARLRAVGVDVSTKLPQGVLKPADLERLVRWAHSFTEASREPELRYAFGRYLYLSGKHQQAIAELDGLSPLSIPLTRGGPEAKWRIRASYIAAAAALADGEVEDAIDRFGRITKAQPKTPGDRRIVELAWMALGRIFHDTADTDNSVAAYRRISRDSPLFPEAMYETTWTLLRAGRFDRAVQALDLMLVYDPESPLVPEIKQLRGKIQIQQRDYKNAESEFLALRREFDGLSGQMQRKLKAGEEAVAYFAAVVGEDLEHFSLKTVLPPKAVPLARGMQRVVQSEELARTVGMLERELAQTRDLLARMEQAMQAKEKARLFNDLGAHTASLDTVDGDLVAVQGELVLRLARQAKGDRVRQLESQRLELRARLEKPLGGRDRMAEEAERIQVLGEQVHKLDLIVTAMRAQLVASERYYEQTRKDQKIDHHAFLNQAAGLREAIAQYEEKVARLRDRVSRAQVRLRYHDPRRDAWHRALVRYQNHLVHMYGALAKVAADDPQGRTLWRRSVELQERTGRARGRLEGAAVKRLEGTMAILVAERANLDQYLHELTQARASTKDLVAQVLAASYQDLLVEVRSLVVRSEVGLLDVAWGMKEAEMEQVQRLELERDRDLRELDRALEAGLGVLEP